MPPRPAPKIPLLPSAAPAVGDWAPVSPGHRTPTWGILVIGLLVAFLAVGGVKAITDNFRGHIEANLALTQLEKLLYQQAARERADLNNPRPNAGYVTTGTLREGAAEALGQLGRSGVDESTLALLRAELGNYEAAIDEMGGLLAAGQGDAARLVDAEKVLPRLETLRATIDAASARANANAQRDNRLMEGSVAGIIVLAVLASSGLSWRWERARALLERRLAHQAYHDALTGLPNRVAFVASLDRAIARTSGRREAPAVLFLDLDGFKHVNDSLGHAAGDQLLVVVAERLRACLRPEDIVARLGGDEFTILLTDPVDLHGAVRVAERVTAALTAPIVLDGRAVTVTTSIGIVLGTVDYHRGDDLLRDADVAMYQAKHGGKARYAVFEVGMNAGALGRLELESDLRRAVAGDEFVVHYQPKVTLATGRIAGVEALVRWQHPQRGLLFPADFIPLAEETGLIVPLGRWVLAESCRQVRAWQEATPAAPPLGLCVNLSARQFRHPDLVEDVAQALLASGLAPGSLTLEITESLLMAEAETAYTTLRALKNLGLGLAIDDFGTGYSSLAYLKRFPVDLLKIDKAFVAGLGHDPADTGIVRAVLALAATLELEVVAEGVETKEQCAELRALGCVLGQGYHFAKPQDAAAMAALLAADPASLPAAPLTLVRRS